MGAPHDGAGRMLRAIQGADDTAVQLRQWFDLWEAGGRDLGRCPALVSALNAALRHYAFRVSPAETGEPSGPAVKGARLPRSAVADEWLETAAGRPVQAHFSTNGRREPLIARAFAAFVLGAEADDLRRCARPGCGKYFLRTRRRTKYHSAACARFVSARAAMKARRTLMLNRRIWRARGAIARFGKDWPLNWKRQLAKAAKTTPQWIARHVRLGHLPGPPAG